MEFSLQGQEVSRLCFDYAVGIETLEGSELQIETSFMLGSVDCDMREEVQPDRLAETGFAVLRLLRQRVTAADVDETGALRIQFTNGQVLECPPDPMFEAWTYVSASGERKICMPGGGVADWPGASTA
ncbi:DUF6188 family protein [Cellulomonas sp. NPDC058312]|uniref:DUF6188 family protein n=1 Tax=Cellulomonas sp. NPDC058312 TaxID=3346441 RepID=UPI0036E1D367